MPALIAGLTFVCMLCGLLAVRSWIAARAQASELRLPDNIGFAFSLDALPSV